MWIITNKKTRIESKEFGQNVQPVNKSVHPLNPLTHPCAYLQAERPVLRTLPQGIRENHRQFASYPVSQRRFFNKARMFYPQNK